MEYVILNGASVESVTPGNGRDVHRLLGSVKNDYR
jgi:hypothetical protein